MRWRDAGLDRAALFQAMLAAFADYVVPMKISRHDFDNMLAQRGFDPGLSFVAVENGAVQAFWNLGRRGDQAYLMGSGTIPDARGQGLSSALGRAAIAACAAAGVARFSLEVITSNSAALGLYEKLGFARHRVLDCYQLGLEGAADARFETVKWDQIADAVAPLIDWAPSWQNAAQSLSAIGPTCLAHFDGDRLLAFGAMNARNGTIYQFAVAPEARRHGLGRALFGALAAQHPEVQRLINLDHADAPTAQFCAALGAERFLQQYEMAQTV